VSSAGNREEETVALWQYISRLITARCHHSRSFRLKLTGEPPSNAAEKLIGKIAGNRREMPLEWLEKRVCHELYAEELRLTRYTADIGLCGRDLFHKEAGAILAGIRPEFGYICEAARPGVKAPRANGESV
jgi:hypothetical protein